MKLRDCYHGGREGIAEALDLACGVIVLDDEWWDGEGGEVLRSISEVVVMRGARDGFSAE